MAKFRPDASSDSDPDHAVSIPTSCKPSSMTTDKAGGARYKRMITTKSLHELFTDVEITAEENHKHGHHQECILCQVSGAIKRSRVFRDYSMQAISRLVLAGDEDDLCILLAATFCCGMRYGTETALTAIVEGKGEGKQ